MHWLSSATLSATILAGATLPAMAQETMRMGAISDPGYEAALWALMNGKVSDPSLTLTVDLMPIPAMIQASMTGQYDILPNGTIAIAQQHEAGIDTVILGSMIRRISGPQNHTTDLWVLADSPVQDLDGLAGKKIAVTSIEAQDVIYRRSVMEEKYGYNADSLGGDFDWVEIPSTQFESALQTGSVDAVAFSNVSAYQVTFDDRYRSVFQGAPDLEEMLGGPPVSVVVSAPRERVEDKPEAYKAATQLLRQSALYALENQDEVFGAVAAKYDMSKEELQGWFTTFAGMPFALGPTDAQTIQAQWGAGQKLGILQDVPNVEDFIWEFAVRE